MNLYLKKNNNINILPVSYKILVLIDIFLLKNCFRAITGFLSASAYLKDLECCFIFRINITFGNNQVKGEGICGIYFNFKYF